MAYNEVGNIANAIRSAFEQPAAHTELVEVIVVASGCTDGTDEVVAALAATEPRLQLIVEEERAGKASAINRFIRAARSPVLVLANADTIVRHGALDALVGHFRDPAVGMVGGHPVPVNDEDTFLGYTVHLLWRLHDQIARETPKLGEIIAFRNVLPRIPADTAVDEMSIQAMITRLGYRLVYEPEAVVFNRGPSTVSDFICQRRRISAGHFRVAREEQCPAPTMSARRVGRAVIADQRGGHAGAPWWTLGAVTLEATARALGWYDVLRNRSHHVWAAVATTKGDLAAGRRADPTENLLVFHVVGFVDETRACGGRSAHDACRHVMDELEARLGPGAVVSGVAHGTVVALLPGDRAVAESAARRLVDDLAVPRVARVAHEPATPAPAITLDCVVISFPGEGIPLAGALPSIPTAPWARAEEVCAS